MHTRIAIVQRIVTDYRVAFYSDLHDKLAACGVELTVFAGQPLPSEGFKDGLDQLAFGVRATNHYLHDLIYWQNLAGQLAPYDLVIIEQANKTLLNYVLIVGRHALHRPQRLAFWGHGAKLNGAGSFANGFKRRVTGMVDHWFAYTSLSRDIVAATGFPPERITVLNNSVDTTAVRTAAGDTARVGKSTLRHKLGLADRPTLVFCARLTPGKRLDFLLDATTIAQHACPELQLVIIGDGPQRALAEQYAERHSWIIVKGALYGAEKAAYLAAADIMALPSWVGLSILDGFAAGLPVLAADFGNHSPEIAYLEEGVNGFLTQATPQAYAEAITRLCRDSSKRVEMSNAAIAAADHYSMSAMTDNFVSGALSALKR